MSKTNLELYNNWATQKNAETLHRKDPRVTRVKAK